MSSKTEYKLGKTSDLKDGQMKEIEVEGEEGKVLLYNWQGEFYATSPKCPHYGAPLKNGVLAKGSPSVVCPWHGSVFNIKSGDIEAYPSVDALNTFPVTSKNGEIFISATPEEIKSFSRKPCEKSSTQSKSEEHVVIVGGGAGGFATAQSLRVSGYKGKVTLLSADEYLPFDRTKLSKALITDSGKILLRDEAFYKDNDISVQLNTQVTKVDADAKVLETSNGQVNFTHLVLATGGTPNKLPLDGFDLGNIFPLRSLQDVKKIVAARDSKDGGEKKKIIVVGSSFIGTEVAVALKDHEVTLIGMEKVPFEKQLGEKIGAAVQKIHEKNGVKFYLDAGVESAVPNKKDSSKVGGVKLKSGETLEANFVILAIGVKPATSFLKESGFGLEKDGSLLVDENLQVKGHKDIFAIGDIATYPVLELGATLRIEHWNVAQGHGKHVAEVIAKGVGKPYNLTPYFWSAQGSQLRYCGNGSVGYDDIIIKGNLSESKFAGFYSKGENVVAVVSMGMDPVVSKSAILLQNGEMISKSDLTKGVDILDV